MGSLTPFPSWIKDEPDSPTTTVDTLSFVRHPPAGPYVPDSPSTRRQPYSYFDKIDGLPCPLTEEIEGIPRSPTEEIDGLPRPLTEDIDGLPREVPGCPSANQAEVGSTSMEGPKLKMKPHLHHDGESWRLGPIHLSDDQAMILLKRKHLEFDAKKRIQDKKKALQARIARDTKKLKDLEEKWGKLLDF